MRVILCGAAGRMGAQVRASIASSNAYTLVAAVDLTQPSDLACPYYADLANVKEEADLLVDFSHHTATPSLLQFALARKMPLVIATTGQTQEELAQIKEASTQIPIFLSGNMSIGIALLASLVKQAAQAFPQADIEIVETHHNQKLDVPSGTALMLANAAKEGRGGAATFCVGRHENGKRPAGEIGLHSLRLGNVVGEHEVRIDTGTQTITLKHQSHSRALFAEGALTAAAFLVQKGFGLYSVNDLFA